MTAISFDAPASMIDSGRTFGRRCAFEHHMDDSKKELSFDVKGFHVEDWNGVG